jgi:hypothetical protein
MVKYSIKKINPDKLGQVAKRKVNTDDERGENAIENLVKNINCMGKHKKGKKYKIDLDL